MVFVPRVAWCLFPSVAKAFLLLVQSLVTPMLQSYSHCSATISRVSLAPVATVEHFYNTTVFPKEAREFEKKLVSSAWDLILMSGNLRAHQPSRSNARHENTTGPSLSTGFSGTNDFSGLLPLSVRQQDLETLLLTNAEVLVHLLQPRNRSYRCTVDSQGRRLATKGLVDLISKQKPPPRILLDAGAQILDMKNRDLAQYWHGGRADAPATIYFDEMDKGMIVHEDGRQEILSSSSYAPDSGKCLVYMTSHIVAGLTSNFQPMLMLH